MQPLRTHHTQSLHHLRRFNVPPPTSRDDIQYAEDFGGYLGNFGSVLTLAVASDQIQIEADSDFELVKLAASGNKNGAAEPWPDNQIIPFNLQIADGGSGRQLFNEPLPLNSICGTGKLPMILPVFRRFNARTTILLTVTSYSLATWDNVTVTLLGKKIFKTGPGGA